MLCVLPVCVIPNVVVRKITTNPPARKLLGGTVHFKAMCNSDIPPPLIRPKLTQRQSESTTEGDSKVWSDQRSHSTSSLSGKPPHYSPTADSSFLSGKISMTLALNNYIAWYVLYTEEDEEEEFSEEGEDEPDKSTSAVRTPRKTLNDSGVFSSSVVVKGLPSGIKEFVLELYMQNISGADHSVEVKIGGSLAVVEFPEPVGEFKNRHTK